MPVIVPIASGKGGVGKTITALHLALGLASHGKAVVLVDGDSGSSNLHTLLGVPKEQPGIGSIIQRQERHISDLILATSADHLFFIPGDGWNTGTSNPPYWVKRRLGKELQELVADFVILDLSPGTGLFTLDMFLLSNFGLVVTTPEIPSLLNSYSFIKHAALRSMQQLTPRNTPEGAFFENLHRRNIGSKGTTLPHLIEELHSQNPELAERCSEQLTLLRPQLVLTLGTNPKDLDFGSTLRDVTMAHLGVKSDFIGFVPWYAQMRSLVNGKNNLFSQAPDSSTAKSYRHLAQRVLSFENSVTNRYIPPDLEELGKESQF
ncbi:P-loop NTPase [Spirochaeta lutea]|uniref:P-loop NTPase n=1 Tax=Spirochaeta lutea TaxID=1480694 RepID=UPI00068CEFA9|nr:P-loop NTPase [Spirochaeta lutea]